jgi:hypothetical protein
MPSFDEKQLAIVELMEPYIVTRFHRLQTNLGGAESPMMLRAKNAQISYSEYYTYLQQIYNDCEAIMANITRIQEHI